MLRVIMKEMRVHQWTKNVFVFAPLVFGRRLSDPWDWAATVGAFLAMCAAASATYIVNDLQDLEADRLHPRKRHRPIASGALPVALARSLAIGLFLAAGIIALCLGWWSLLTLGLYVAITLGYSMGLKSIPLVELFLVAAGFVLRVLLGSAATSIPPSPWMLLTMLCLALLLAFGKRRGEIARHGSEAAEGRKVLAQYTLRFLDRCITLLAGSTFLCYAIYSTAEVTVRKMGTPWLVATTPFVAFGIFRYLYVIEQGDHAVDAPSDLLLSDRPIQVTIFLWLATAIAVVYSHAGSVAGL